MTVAELIVKLQTMPQDLQVAYCRYSEQCLLEENEIDDEFIACEPRPDGWIQHKRPDMPSQRYVLLPGN